MICFKGNKYKINVMSNDFDYENFANILRFQVRGLVPIKEEEKNVRDLVYKVSIEVGKALCSIDDVDEDTCKVITQIIAEWTFHKYMDLLRAKIKNIYFENVISVINAKIYDFLLEHKDSICILGYSKVNQDLILKVEKLVRKIYRTQLYSLYSEGKISKASYYSSLLKPLNIDTMNAQVGISLLQIFKYSPFISILYIIVIAVLFTGFIFCALKGYYILSVIPLILLVSFLISFFTRKFQIIINLHEQV